MSERAIKDLADEIKRVFLRGRSPGKKAKPGVGERIKSMRVPSPGAIMDGLVSDTVASLHRPLVSRQRVENQALQRERQKLVETSTVSELASLKGPLDIPMPKFRSQNRSKSEEDHKDREKEAGDEE